MSGDVILSAEGVADGRKVAAEPYDAAAAARIAALDAVSDEHAASLRPANTTRGYAGDWAKWVAFTDEKQLPATAATRGTLRAFVAWLWENGAAPSTIDRRLAGVVVTLRREHRITINPDDTRAAREMLKDYIRQAAEGKQPPRGRGQTPPLLLPDLRRISEGCPDSLTGLRDRALVLLAFAIAGRRSELAGLTVRDVADDPNGLVVDVRVTKTKPRTVAVPYGSNPLTCPVRAWRAWRDAAQLHEPESPGFRRIDRHGRLLGALSGQAVGDVVTRAGARAGVEARLTGHSARAGLATEARRAGKDRKAIAATTGHAPNSPVLDRYLRTVDRWGGDDNALIGIGL